MNTPNQALQRLWRQGQYRVKAGGTAERTLLVAQGLRHSDRHRAARWKDLEPELLSRRRFGN
jgi:hypothetical protein